VGGPVHRDNRRAAVIIAGAIGLVRIAEPGLNPTEDGVRTVVPSRNPGQLETMRRQNRAGIPSGALAAAEAALAGSAMETARFSPVKPTALETHRIMRRVIPRLLREIPRQGVILVIILVTKRRELPGKRVPMGPG
jgi:hypothetical protein